MEEYQIPKGFSFLGKHVGIKKKRKDYGVIAAENSCVASAVFTKNICCGESIPIGKDAIKNHELQAIIVTSGVANVATGAEGRENAFRLIKSVSSQLGIEEENILPSSTGVIGPQLPIEKILKHSDKIQSELSANAIEDFAHAICTTDKCIKIKSKKVGNATITGIAKGSGMIEPNMATMLVYLITDAVIEKEQVDILLKESVDETFNKMSVDSDTSTSDTVVLMASGKKGIVDPQEFQKKLTDLCLELTLDILHDAEGATHLLEVNIEQAPSKEEATRIGKAVINSPLVKTSIYGHDPNWGRIIMAIGKVATARISLESLSIRYGNYSIYQKGREVSENISSITEYLKENKDILININLNAGESSSTVYGCDLTDEYVRINGEYST